MRTERVRERVWAVMVGLVLADSSIVTLALPDVLRAFDTTVFGVSWVLTAFNLVLAVAILPASRLARRMAPPVWAAGLVVFASASFVCAVAPSIGVLIAARCVQALGGAAVIAAAIELLAGTRGSHRRAAPVWGTAGIVGLAVGPAAGGLLTELFSWEAIFLDSAPGHPGGARGDRAVLARRRAGPGGADRPGAGGWRWACSRQGSPERSSCS